MGRLVDRLQQPSKQAGTLLGRQLGRQSGRSLSTPLHFILRYITLYYRLRTMTWRTLHTTAVSVRIHFTSLKYPSLSQAHFTVSRSCTHDFRMFS